MSNPALKHARNGSGPQMQKITANSICPLPLVGYKPSGIAGPDGQLAQPTPVLCMRDACAWWVALNAQGAGACAMTATAVVLSSLPGAFHQFFTSSPQGDAAPAEPIPTQEASTNAAPPAPPRT